MMGARVLGDSVDVNLNGTGTRLERGIMALTLAILGLEGSGFLDFFGNFAMIIH